MYKNGLSYARCTAVVLLTHIVMLAAILLRGNYGTLRDIVPLGVVVLGLDLVYTVILRFFYKQMTYTMDFFLLLLLGISVIFQSCFGGIHCTGYVSGWISVDKKSCLDSVQEKNTIHHSRCSDSQHPVSHRKPQYVDYHWFYQHTAIRIYEAGFCSDLCYIHPGTA